MRRAGYNAFPSLVVDELDRIDLTDLRHLLEEVGIDSETEQFDRAEESCAVHLQDVTLFDPTGIEQLEADLVVFAECMRSQGIDLPDPDLARVSDGQTPELQGPFEEDQPPGVFGDTVIDLDDPETNAAFEECAARIDLPLPELS
jgi:hypothetical protein